MALTYREISGTHIDVFSNNLRIAQISENVLTRTSNRQRWHWKFTTTSGPRGFQFHGDAETLSAVVAAVERNWQFWLTAARHVEETTQDARVSSARGSS